MPDARLERTRLAYKRAPRRLGRHEVRRVLRGTWRHTTESEMVADAVRMKAEADRLGHVYFECTTTIGAIDAAV